MSGILRFTIFSAVILSLFLPSVMTKSQWQRTFHTLPSSRQKHCNSNRWSKECILGKLHKSFSVFDTFRYFLSGSRQNKGDGDGSSLPSSSSMAAPTTSDQMTPLRHMSPVTLPAPTPSEREMWTMKKNLFHLENEPCGMSYTNKLQSESWTTPGEYPWLAVLLYESKDMPHPQLQNLCGGTLINDRYVLTSAYCLSIPKYELEYVRLGEFNVEYFEKDCKDLEENIFDIIAFEACSTIPPIDYDYSEIILHPKYVYHDDVICGTHDIGLIRLAQRVIFTDQIHPVCLPVGSMKSLWNSNDVGANFTVVGWGMMNVVPLRSTALLREKSTCSNALGKNLLQGQFCVDNEDDTSCHGDIGGAIMTSINNDSHNNGTMRLTKTVQVGVLSSIFCNSSTPLYFTSVEAYLPWILEKMDP
ncbi:hypothetical protein J437_LFUL003854 [Ladona fulva]|uniref:Peptidase S1 domain-containing protein n=1 Tax=Ladona fulva TaxID=123851 RepID=A0A8K0P5G1_LADFU|nr:hypothetical protein J437_LFUL003854 [Ladona fulva]